MALFFYEKIRDHNRWTEMNPVTKLTVVCMWECFQTGTGSNVPKFNGFVHGWRDQVLQENIKIINYFVIVMAINKSFII